MAEKLEIPVEIKYQFAAGAFADTAKGFLYAYRKKYGAEATLEFFEMWCKDEDRVKNLTNTILKIFKIEGNDAETFAKWFEIWDELSGKESSLLELSKTIARIKVTKCPFKLDYEDLNEIRSIMINIVAKTINPKATVECPKGMCAGDPYCEYVWRIEE